jgi:hypothetical protein
LTSKGRFSVALLIAVLLVSSFPDLIFHDGAANPIAIGSDQSFGFLILDSNMSMPEALVNMTIAPIPQGGTSVSYNITMNAVYTFLTPTNQNATIGLACPNNWFDRGYEARIFDNGSLIPHIFLHYNELVGENDTYPVGYQYLDYVTFNCTLEAGNPTDIIVQLDLGTLTHQNGLSFHYWVASARTWNGTTHETIIMNLKNPSLLRSCYFSPNVSLTVVSKPSWRIATWNLDMDVFEDDVVGFSTMHYQPFWPEIDPNILLIGGITASIVIAIVVMVGVLVKRR